MLIAQIVLILLTLCGALGTYFLLKKKGKNTDVFLKCLSFILAGVFAVRFMIGTDHLENIFALDDVLFSSKFASAFSLLINWFVYSIFILVFIYPFCKNKFTTTIIKYFGIVVAVLAIGCLNITTIGIVGKNAYAVFNIRTLLMGIDLALLLAYVVIVWLKNEKFEFSKKDWGILAVLFGCMVLVSIPQYMLQALFGKTNNSPIIEEFSFLHRMILYVAILMPFTIYLCLRNKSQNTKRYALLYLALATMITFCLNYRLVDFRTITNMPFHLCHTAMFILPICLIFKTEKVFYFTYFINVLGAFIAMIMPNYDIGLNILSTRVIGFYVNHFMAFFMPLLVVALGVYKKPKLKHFKYSMMGFAVYFIFVVIINAWFSNYGSVDYFFVNSGFIASKLGEWAEKIMMIKWQFNIGSLNFLFFPLYQLLFFIVYVAMGAGVWFVYEAAYSFGDTVYDIINRKKKIAVDYLANASKNGGELMENNNEIKLEIINFSKKYARSKDFAVKNANLTIQGGDIFGFLGHNGAGKSTIIKSIVGIQPITEGNIKVCGYDVESQSVECKKQIGFVPDHYALYEKLTGREYVNYIADLYNVSEEKRTQTIEEYVKLFELEYAFDNAIKTYSHGMKQKITIISALVHEPKVWILDEPLTGLDPNSIYQVKECMKAHAKKGNIVFFSSHLIDIVEQLCDKIAIIKKGQILKVVNVSELDKSTSLEQLYLDANK